jgi:hypothetical protein
MKRRMRVSSKYVYKVTNHMNDHGGETGQLKWEQCADRGGLRKTSHCVMFCVLWSFTFFFWWYWGLNSGLYSC